MAGSKRSRREKRRYEAPLNGSVDSLKQLLVEDPLTCYDETPLHVALMLGHLDFAKFVESQTRHGYGSGLAGAFTSSLGCCQWLYGRTPLHLAVLKGQVEVTSELVRCRPEVIRFRLDQGKTLVHLAVKQNRLGALKLLFELGREDDDDLVSVKNDHGNTILHIAAGFKQTETIKYLLGRTGVKHEKVDHQFMEESDITPVTKNTQLAAPMPPPPPPPPAAPLAEANARARS
ncbi:ankyrin repeat domain-containing protein 2-like [Vitis riparia]|uniref:ankyrin repeat domain-containing protein 2-like n=1 Tax=Vitis riparia TaxID=96939 RepID=UPI00155A8F96|nr:ankyrin repeat domain-containing protein 2-like [Vitis riparia]